MVASPAEARLSWHGATGQEDEAEPQSCPPNMDTCRCVGGHAQHTALGRALQWRCKDSSGLPTTGAFQAMLAHLRKANS